MTDTPTQPKRPETIATGGPLVRKLKAKLSRRVAIALGIALAALMASALAVPPLAVVLLVVLPAGALVVMVAAAVHWFKHRPMPRRYDDNGKLQPNKIEGLALIMFAYSPMWVRAALVDSPGLNLSLLIAGASMVPLYFVGKLALFRWWIPRRERTAAS